MNRKLASLLFLATLGQSVAAIAAPPPAVYKTMEGEIVIHSGLTASQIVSVEYPNIPAKRNIKAGYCGTVTVPNTSAQPIGATVMVDNVTIDVSTLPVQTLPRCENNVLVESRPANFKLANGNVVVVGKTAGITSVAEYVGSNFARNARANNCAFFVVRPTTNLPIGTEIKLNGVEHTVASLPVDYLPQCRNINNVATRYNPASW